MKHFLIYILLFITLCHNAAKGQAGAEITLQSPDKNIVFKFYQKQVSSSSLMFYTASYKGQPVVLESLLAIDVETHFTLATNVAEDYSKDLQVKLVERIAVDTAWQPLFGERSIVPDQYNGITITLVKEFHNIEKLQAAGMLSRSDDKKTLTLQLQVRAYNSGIAFRYFFPETNLYHNVLRERTEFSLPEGTRAYHASWAQAPYVLMSLKDWQHEAERPMPLVLPGGRYACLTEAGTVDYSRTKFGLSATKANTLVTSMAGAADLMTPVGTPWRLLMVADKPGDLIENSHIVLNLNAPPKIKDASWIKPGKIMREVTLTTEGARACIDFAATHNMQYILFDWKWYGPAFSVSSDASKVVVPIDMPGVIAYGKEKGVGVFLYVNQQALFTQLDEILPVYQKWGVKGLKFGFVNVGAHRWTSWMQDAFKKAAAHQLLVNVHDEYRPTGEQRTWPNFINAEGIHGNEEFPDATQNLIQPFSRYIGGPADYTICYYDKRIKTTHAHQLAIAAVYYTPLLTLFWYDKPTAYGGEPEIEFFEKIPTVWHDTKVIHASIGEYITTARRNGDDWFVGTMTNTEARTLRLALSFLPKGKKYIATIYSDDPTVKTSTHVKVEKKKVDSASVLDVILLASGGQAIWLTPAGK